MTKPNTPMATKGWVLTHLMQRFLVSESKAGIILIACTLLSLLLSKATSMNLPCSHP